MTSYIPIVPIDIVKQITSFRVDGLLMNLFVGVNISVSTFDNDKKLIDTRVVYLTGEDYSNWNNDDQYIINKVAEKLGFIMVTSIPNPTINPTPGLIVNPIVDPTPDPTPDPIVDPTPDPIADPTPDPIADPTPDPVI